MKALVSIPSTNKEEKKRKSQSLLRKFQAVSDQKKNNEGSMFTKFSKDDEADGDDADFIYFLLCWDQTQNLVIVRQALPHWAKFHQ